MRASPFDAHGAASSPAPAKRPSAWICTQIARQITHAYEPYSSTARNDAFASFCRTHASTDASAQPPWVGKLVRQTGQPTA
jgi:hypothetical protein